MTVIKVVKRDGSTEDFIPQKVNAWQQWAGETVQDKVDWSDIVLETIKKLPSVVTSAKLQEELIKTCMDRNTWSYGLMAGRLYSSNYRKDLYRGNIPTVYQLHMKLAMLGLMAELNYSDEDYQIAESYIDHSKDFDMSYTQLLQLRKKYAIIDKDVTPPREFETPQFISMRMAMALAEKEPTDVRMAIVKDYYTYFSNNKINCPTPYYVNLGTTHNGYASCCLYTTDDTACSLSIGDHIAYTMTYMSAGIGGFINSRSLNDTIRNGAIIHQGKLPYFKSLASAVNANLQGGRGGACTTYFSCYDPEVNDIIMLQNPRTPVDKQNREIHFAMMFNKNFIKRVVQNKDYFVFNNKTAPELMDAFISGDTERFEELYLKYEQDPNFTKFYLSARDIASKALRQCHEVATLYLIQIDEVNRHTPYKEKVYSSNLCLEVTQPTSPYNNMKDLYNPDNSNSGEISLCSLGAIVISNIENDQDYYDACYYTLKMIDVCIHKSTYVFDHLKTTALSRMNAGVGIVGLAHYLAKKGLTYNSQEGLDEIHRVSERHMYFMIKASLKLSKELGVAPWMHKTKWVDGWLPIDTYSKSIDKVTITPLLYNWEELRQQVIENKGIRNSSLVAHMPTESSSKATGLPNGLYPIRSLTLSKTDSKNAIKWVAMDNDDPTITYQIAWDLTVEDMCKVYGVVQKFTDQAISADFYKNRVKQPDLKASELLEELICMYKYGLKTRYYTNSLTVDSVKLGDNEESKGCTSGACTL